MFGDNYRAVQVRNDQKVTINIAQSSSSTFAKHNPRACPIKVPTGEKLYLRPFEDDSYLLRIQNFNLKQTTFEVPSGW